jgi:hypothetical protein
MGRHRAGDAAPSSDWIERVLGKRHRLSLYHDPEGALASESALLRMYPHKSDVEDYAHRDEAYRNLGTSAALHVVRDVFADYDCYVLRLSEQRIIEHRPMRSNDALHSDVFIETHEIVDRDDVFSVRIVFTDPIGALVFTHFATFVGRVEAPAAAKPAEVVQGDSGTRQPNEDVAASN